MTEGQLETVIGFADNPQNCFDRFLSDNKNGFQHLSSKQLKFLLDSREACEKATEAVKFTRKELEAGVREGLVSPDGILARVYNNFLIAETFFE
ncbi:MAG: hypothetical protein IJZ57_04785 [Clostridia bacterium]|nr:hypothetical protein [Clostridia bacterium]